MKKRMDNYPDDIRSFDHHPGSPFFQAPHIECAECGTSRSDEDMIALYEGDNDDERRFCDEDCLDKHIEENAGEVYQELVDVIDELQSKLRKK